MSAQVGIPQYRDLVNSSKIASLKEKINFICINYAKLSSKEAIDNRENENIEIYMNQYNVDMGYLKQICHQAQELVNTCNETMFLINNGAIDHHIYDYGE